MHHTGSQAENPVVVPEELEEQLEVQPQEVLEAMRRTLRSFRSALITTRAPSKEASP
jgi:hypothetical protein